MSKWRRTLLVVSLLSIVGMTSAAHAQVSPGDANGGLTVTLPTTGGATSTPAPAGSHLGFGPAPMGVWLQAISAFIWPSPAKIQAAPHLQKKSVSRAARTR